MFGRYHSVFVKTWLDSRFLALTPAAKLAFLHFLTSPALTPLGCAAASAPRVAHYLAATPRATAKAARELQNAGLVLADDRVWYSPRFVAYNPPDNPKVAAAWGSCAAGLPESPLTALAIARARGILAAKGQAFLDAFNRKFPVYPAAPDLPNLPQPQTIPNRGRYGIVYEKIWRDHKFLSLSWPAKLLFLCLLTHPLTTGVGVVFASPASLGHSCSLSPARAAKASAELESAALVRRDALVYYLPNFIKYNPAKNENVARNQGAGAATLPESPLAALATLRARDAAASRGGACAAAFAEKFPPDAATRAEALAATLQNSDTHPDTPTDTLPDTGPDTLPDTVPPLTFNIKHNNILFLNNRVNKARKSGELIPAKHLTTGKPQEAPAPQTQTPPRSPSRGAAKKQVTEEQTTGPGEQTGAATASRPVNSSPAEPKNPQQANAAPLKPDGPRLADSPKPETRKPQIAPSRPDAPKTDDASRDAAPPDASRTISPQTFYREGNFSVPCLDGEALLDDAYVADLVARYALIDVKAQLINIRERFRDAKDRRKTRAALPGFIQWWLDETEARERRRREESRWASFKNEPILA